MVLIVTDLEWRAIRTPGGPKRECVMG